MITARLEAGAATAGQGTELTVISAVVIGGVSLFGGEGKIAGVLLGVLLLGLVQNAINLLNVPPNYDYVVERPRDRGRRGARRLSAQLSGSWASTPRQHDRAPRRANEASARPTARSGDQRQGALA